MRTAIYVHEPSTVTIRATSPRDAKAQLCRFNQDTDQAALGTHNLEPGVYMIVSTDALEVNVHGVDVHVLANDKDIWPDPKASVVALEPGASVASLRDFFQIARDDSPDD